MVKKKAVSPKKCSCNAIPKTYAVLRYSAVTYYLRCSSCGKHTLEQGSEASAVTVWNKLLKESPSEKM